MLQAQSRLPNYCTSLLYWQRSLLLDDLPEVLALDVLHRQEVRSVGLVGVVRLDDVRVIELSGGMDFALKPLGSLGTIQPFLANDLQGDEPTHRGMPRLEHRAHAAFAQPFEDDVVAEPQLGGLAGRNLVDL